MAEMSRKFGMAATMPSVPMQRSQKIFVMARALLSIERAVSAWNLIRDLAFQMLTLNRNQ